MGWKNPTGTLASGWDQMIKYFSSMSTFHESVSHNSCCGGRVDFPGYFTIYLKKNAFGHEEVKFTANK